MDTLSELASAERIRARCMIVTPHPDDETIGMGGVLWRMDAPLVVYVSDGAPRDPTLWPTGERDRASYAARRRRELIEALASASLAAERSRWLGATDQECIHEVPRLVRALVELIRSEQPEAVIVTPYEGGHPDHDAAALVARAAVSLAARGGRARPSLLEMSSYHSLEGKMQTGSFLGVDPGVERPLSVEDARRKRAMFAAHASQAQVLADFARFDRERYRTAPVYDFTRPAHSPPLLYESRGWSLSASDWCSVARAALGALDLGSDAT